MHLFFLYFSARATIFFCINITTTTMRNDDKARGNIAATRMLRLQCFVVWHFSRATHAFWRTMGVNVWLC